ncbi:MAG: CcoQ/FixQ family Cbb3-type cytochrome c oxidase assembly chaperone [Nitrospirae bacterium]|nr:CcoQ/FixQ family Cbb3-type cytochrome c oxidase assembly chaperone [Nitrospirota bacterium]
MEATWQAIAYVGFTVAMAAVIAGMAYYYYVGSGKETSEDPAHAMMEDED